MPDLPVPAGYNPDIVVKKDGTWYCKACGDRVYMSHRDHVPLHCCNESRYCAGSVDEVTERLEHRDTPGPGI